MSRYDQTDIFRIPAAHGCHTGYGMLPEGCEDDLIALAAGLLGDIQFAELVGREDIYA